MRRLRIILALLIVLSLVTGTFASAWASAKFTPQMSDGASDADAMPDCHKIAKKQAAGHCVSCDSTMPCTDAIDCIKKCGSHIIGYLIAQWRVAPPFTRPERSSDPPPPPDWVHAPPAPPPRA